MDNTRSGRHSLVSQQAMISTCSAMSTVWLPGLHDASRLGCIEVKTSPQLQMAASRALLQCFCVENCFNGLKLVPCAPLASDTRRLYVFLQCATRLFSRVQASNIVYTSRLRFTCSKLDERGDASFLFGPACTR